MTWYAFAGYDGGAAIDLAGIQEKDADAWGFHGYATEAEAEKNPNSVNLLQKVAASNFIADYKAAVAGQEEPGGANASNPVAGAAAAAKTGATAAAKAAANVLGLPTLSNLRDLVARAVKVIAGLALLIVGVSRLTGTDKAVMKAGKAAVAL
jgi:hypothetical protein